METSHPQGKVSIHPASQTSEGVARLAACIEPKVLHDERMKLLGSTKAQFERLRRECLDLAYIMESRDPATVNQMMDGLDVFVASFVKLVEHVGVERTAAAQRTGATRNRPLPDARWHRSRGNMRSTPHFAFAARFSLKIRFLAHLQDIPVHLVNAQVPEG